MPKHIENVIYVYNKNKELLAVFGEEAQGINQTQTLEGLSEKAMRELMVAPTVHIESNGASTFTFQMLANATKWQTIKDPENIYFVNGRYYTPMTENAYEYSGEDTVRLVTVTCVETWYLLQNKYKQAYNCSIYSQCKGTVGITAYHHGQFSRPIYFKGYKSDCSNLSKTISSNNAFQQVQNWASKDNDGNMISYRLIQDENAPKNVWIGAPQLVNITRLTNQTSSPFLFTLTNPVRPVMRVQIPIENEKLDFNSSNMTYQSFSIMDALYDYFQQRYGNETLKINSSTYYIVPPENLKSVEVNYTTLRNEVTSDVDNSDKDKLEDSHTFTIYNQRTYTDKVDFTYSDGELKFKKPPHFMAKDLDNTVSTTGSIYQGKYVNNETLFNYLIVEFEFPNMGAFKNNSTLEYTLSYGAEVVDEHTFLILPKADKKYKLTINNISYEDSQVKDIRGTLLPRGSAGYAMWAALKDTDWQLGICDVVPKDFNPAIDYGTFNVETDMQDVLSIIHTIQSLYGGILDWDSERQILNYRAENSDNYVVYNDDFNKWKGFQFREGKNFTDQPTIIYDNNIITKAYILGYGNLNIRKVNNGVSYITNNSYSKKEYEGYLKQELIYDTNDDSGQKQLLYWGKRELAKQCKPRMNISIQATDLRTVNGLEHEIFDINDIVQVHYRDSHDNTEHIELKRIIMWEYNVFAMWDCQVELGDKTQNEIELFKLIYNKSLRTPDTNGSGQISTNHVYLSPTTDNYPNSIGGNLNWISQTTTKNSDAIAGLIIDTSSSYAYAQLFAEYQKRTNSAIKNAYSGLEFYADARSAHAKLESKYYTKDLVTNEISQTKAGLETLVNKEIADVKVYAEGQWKEINGKLKKEIEANAKFQATVTKEYAKISSLATYSITDNKGKIFTLGGMQTYVDDRIALNSIIASFKANNIENVSSLINYAEENLVGYELVASLYNAGVRNYSSITSMVDDKIAEIDIRAEVEDGLSFIRVGSDFIYIYNREYTGDWGAGNQTNIYLDPDTITLNSRQIFIESAENFIIDAIYSTFKYEVTFRDDVYMDRLFFQGQEVEWKKLYIDGDRATVLGWSGRRT